MDELSISEATGGGGAQASRSALEAHSLSSTTASMLQQVAPITDKLNRSFPAATIQTTLVPHVLEHVFPPSLKDSNDPELRLIADVYADDVAEDVLEPLKRSQAEEGEAEFEDL